VGCKCLARARFFSWCFYIVITSPRATIHHEILIGSGSVNATPRRLQYHDIDYSFLTGLL
jgi:hypothetical protein